MEIMKPTLLVLAAGMGSRFGGLKQMAGLGPNGEVLMEYSIYDALKAGFGKVVFVIRKDLETDFNRLVINRLPSNIPVGFVFQELNKLPEDFSTPIGRTKPWGTAHALWCAKNVVKENFVVVNADDFYGSSGFQKLATFFNQQTESQLDGAFIGFRLDKTLSENGSVTRAICRQNEEGWLNTIEETSDIQRKGYDLTGSTHSGKIQLTGNELVSMNLWGFTPKLFGQIDSLFVPWLAQNGANLTSEFLLPFVISELLAASGLKLKVLSSSQNWIGVTYPEDTVSVQKRMTGLWKKGVYPSPLWPDF